MAKLWKLPVVFIIENNKYAMGTSIERSSSTTDFSQRGAVLRHSRRAGRRHGRARRCSAAGARVVAARARATARYILEMLTYRYRGHSMSDPAKYRTREEVQRVREEHDPIEQVRARLVEAEVGEEELKSVDRKVREEVNAAAEFALADEAQVVVGDDELGIDLEARAQAVAALARAVRRVEREVAGRELVERAPQCVHAMCSENVSVSEARRVFASRATISTSATPSARRAPSQRVGEATLDAGAAHEPVDDHLDGVVLVARQPRLPRRRARRPRRRPGRG